MNDLQLIYRQHDCQGLPLAVTLTTADSVFKEIRHKIKPFFQDQILRYDNINGLGAHQFNRRIGRHRWDWLEFELPSFSPCQDDYPSNESIIDQGLLQETEIASIEKWKESITNEIKQEKVYLLVGLQCLMEQSSFSMSMLSNGIPTKHWPCEFQIFEFIITNAPICTFIKYRPHVLV